MNVPGDYPGVSRAYLEVAKTYSNPLLVGPPLCDELVALVEHMFTEEEAELVSLMKPWLPRSAASLARASSMSPAEAAKLLRGLAHDKCVLISYGKGEKERFVLMPIVPGTFESVLVRTSTASLTPWHRRFAELHEALFATGFTVEYFNRPVNPVRYLPVGEVVRALPVAYPSDRLEDILDRYSDFAVGLCQCRFSRQLAGEGCGRSLETCTVMGGLAPAIAGRGRMKQASKRDVLESKAVAEKEGLVTWMMNEESGKFTNASCSCCGCCCGALRTVSEFSQPGFIAPPHFMPSIDAAKCNNCGKCGKACPMGALVSMGEGDGGWTEHRPQRCIGCGLCVTACPQGALTMYEVPGYHKPPGSWPAYLARYTFNYLSNGYNVWRSRRHA